MREEGEGGEGEGGVSCWGGNEVEEDVIGGEVVAVVDAGDVVEVGVLEEGEAVSVYFKIGVLVFEFGISWRKKGGVFIHEIHGGVEGGECS